MYSDLGQACIDEFCPARERMACLESFFFVIYLIIIFFDQLMNIFFISKNIVYFLYML